MVSKANLLIISPHYNAFIKDQIEALSSSINRIEVAIGYNSLVELSCILPTCPTSKYLQKFSKRNLASFINIPNNININLISMVYLRPDGHNKSIGNKLFKALSKWIDDTEIRFDLIHAHFIWPCGYAGYMLRDKYNIPLIITGHGFDVYDLPFRDNEWNAIIRRTLNNSDHIITVSKKNYNTIVQLGAPSEKISIIPNGYNPLLFRYLSKNSARAKLDLPINKRIILSVGNLELVKGQIYLICALDKIIQKNKDILCIIIGTGTQERSLKEMINNLHLSNYIKLVGSKPHDEIPLWMNACDIFVLSSLNEGNPTVMFEALGCGKPFIGTKVGGIQEIIINDLLGILVEPMDPDGLSQAIERGLDIEWDENYILNYARQFTWMNTSGQIMQVYREFLATSH